MSAHTDGQTAAETPADHTSPPVSSATTTAVHDHVPDTLPRKELTIYRDTEVVIRIRPSQSTGDGLCLTMYMHADNKTENLTPARTSHWDDQEFNDSPNTIQALPESIRDRYVEILETVVDRFDIEVTWPVSGYGLCYRRHDTLGKHGVVSFRTRFA
jgi:hypothetical protein